MAWKNIKQRCLADALLIEHRALTELDDILTLINWQSIEKHLADLHSSKKGERAYPPLMMFKALLLQSWYNLSDPQLEQQLARDLLFRRFVGISLDTPSPDHTSLWRFRQKISEDGRLDYLLDRLNAELTASSLIIKTGQISIIDASVIQAKHNRPNKGADGESTQDTEAGYNVKQSSDGKQKTTYGYKAHLNVEEDGFISKAITTSGNVHDSQCFEPLFTGKEQAVYADSAYASAKHDTLLAERHIKNGILKRAYRNTPLTPADKRHNQLLSGIRCTVERVFGVLKQHYGMGQARYRGRLRNHARLLLMSMAYNLKRGLAIQRACAA
jgi:IS5 family transposase